MSLTFHLACRFLTPFWYAQRLKQVTLHASRMRPGDFLQLNPRKFLTSGEVWHSFRSPDLVPSRCDQKKFVFSLCLSREGWGVKSFHRIAMGFSSSKIFSLQWMAMCWPWRFLAPTNMKPTGLKLWPQLPSALRVFLCGPKACLKILHVPLPSIFLSFALSVPWLRSLFWHQWWWLDEWCLQVDPCGTEARKGPRRPSLEIYVDLTSLIEWLFSTFTVPGNFEVSHSFLNLDIRGFHFSYFTILPLLIQAQLVSEPTNIGGKRHFSRYTFEFIRLICVNKNGLEPATDAILVVWQTRALHHADHYVRELSSHRKVTGDTCSRYTQSAGRGLWPSTWPFELPFRSRTASAPCTESQST